MSPAVESRDFASVPLVDDPRIVRVGVAGTTWVVSRRDGDDTVVVLHDTDGDGRADTADAFLEHLIGVTGIVPLGARRALILEPPQLYVAEDRDGDGKAERLDVIARGLEKGRGLALTADGAIHVAGTRLRYRWDGSRARGELSDVTASATAINDGGDGQLLYAIGPLVCREVVRTTTAHRRNDQAELWSCEPLGFTGDSRAPKEIVNSPTFGILAIDGAGRGIVKVRPVGERWGASKAGAVERLFTVPESDRSLASFDVAADGSLYVAIAATADGRGGRIVHVVPPVSVAVARTDREVPALSPRDREALIDDVHGGKIAPDIIRARVGTAAPGLAPTVWTGERLFIAARCDMLDASDIAHAMTSRSAATRAAALRLGAEDEVIAEAVIEDALVDPSDVVRRQALEIIARHPPNPRTAELLARSTDRLTREPSIAAAVAGAMVAAGADADGDSSPSVTTALTAARLSSRDGVETRDVVEQLLAEPGAQGTLDGAVAALKLNDRRPLRLTLDGAPRGFNVEHVQQLDPELQRVIRRLQWPGRADPAMDPEPPASIAEVVERGRRVYSNCLTCHGAAGGGQLGVYPPLVGSPYVLGDAERFAKIILHGLEGPVEVAGRTYAGTMPPPPLNSDDDVAAVMTFVRQAFGNSAEAVSAELVARVRAATALRVKPWTAKELDAVPTGH
ncbi:MAG: c-type cytochrome [Phycisphaerae bacterium]|nr:c-type cytochrome [Phycisphaerae bacterium]